MAPKVEYLEHVIAWTGLVPAPCEVEVVLKTPKPQNKKELQSFFGLINCYRTFLQTLLTHLQRFHLLLQ